MTTRTYHASCHCGDVKLEADLDLTNGAGKCNCSICSKSRNWSISVKPGAVRLLAGEDKLTDYHFGSHSVHWPFCSRCGVRVHGYGEIAEMGGKFVSIRLSALDGVSADDLAAIPVRFCNGRNNAWHADVTEAEKKIL
jgi:hypothetical protein